MIFYFSIVRAAFCLQKPLPEALALRHTHVSADAVQKRPKIIAANPDQAPMRASLSVHAMRD